MQVRYRRLWTDLIGSGVHLDSRQMEPDILKPALQSQVVSKRKLPAFRQWLSDQQCLVTPRQPVRWQPWCEDGCLVVVHRAGREHRPLGAVGLSLSTASINLLCCHQGPGSGDILAKLMQSIERLGVRYGMTELRLELQKKKYTRSRFPAYRVKSDHSGVLRLQRSLLRRQTRIARLAYKINQDLGVPASYGRDRHLKLQAEPSQLASIGLDVFGREQFMTPAAANAFLLMVTNAADEGISLQAVSAFRSVEYQAGLLRRKLDKGQAMDEILRVSAAPGYSEHHSGCAVDISTPGEEPLEEGFATTPAYKWLTKNAKKYGFRLSYPRGNRHGVAWEPWHWFYTGKRAS